jgi:phosphohistidine swiveling domain-containing protein
MTQPDRDQWCLRLDSERANLATVGGKGASLAMLARAGIPVPAGFHLTTQAYRHFLSHHDLGERIQSIVDATDATDPAATGAASRDIAELFEASEVPSALVDAITAAYQRLGTDAAVAVRSSATAEDLPEASFAGQMESYLNVRGESPVVAAVRNCWASLWTARAIEYRARQGIASADVALAVVVQLLVDAESAGVLFTADPVSGNRDHTVVNAAWGLGESLVGGSVSPDTVVVATSTATIARRDIADKAVETVRITTGTEERPVPQARRRQPVLDDQAAIELAAIGARIATLYRRPMDVEWARSTDGFAIVQARPITTLPPAGPAREVWNDSLTGDYLWTASNLGEAVPSVMTPVTWSLLKHTMAGAMAMPEVADIRLCGNIGGRFYLNYSMLIGGASAIGMGKLMERAADLAFGRIPAEVEVPPIPLGRWKLLRLLLPDAMRFNKTVKKYQKDLSQRLAEFPARCDAARAAVAAAADPAALLTVWDDHCGPVFRDGPRMLAAGSRVNGMSLARFTPWLRQYADDNDVNALLSGAHGPDAALASLGPLIGLRELSRGEIDRETFARRWGHRCPDELEVSAPRPGEDPAWVERQLAGLADAADVEELLTRQVAAREAAMRRFAAAHPGKVTQLRRRMAQVAEALRAREDTRSEAVRCMWAVRDWIVRAGELSGLGDEIFFLSLAEIQELLAGGTEAVSAIPARQAAYRHYQTLPSYPTLIRGRFAPEAWAADPHRRSDLYDAHAETGPAESDTSTIVGTPGSTGVVEGIARVIDHHDDSAQLAVGEILITKVTNIGWAPIFPRAAAVVTDVGATLSHAAIVARELGIPAVVGTGTATTRIHTGDHIRVNGNTGTIHILASPGDATGQAQPIPAGTSD